MNANAAHAAHMHEDHHGTTADPVLAAATAAAMDAAGGQEAVDEDATEAAVAVAAVLPEEDDADALAEAHAAAAAAHHHHSHHHHLGHHHGDVDEDEEEEDHAAAAHHQHHHHHVVAPIVIGTKTRKNFDERLKELRKFKQKHGHANVPQKYTQNPQLGTWYVPSLVKIVNGGMTSTNESIEEFLATILQWVVPIYLHNPFNVHENVFSIIAPQGRHSATSLPYAQTQSFEALHSHS
jgi:hypothetical protein